MSRGDPQTSLLERFLYLLLRDKVPFGGVEEVLQQVEKTTGQQVIFSEPHMQGYASSLAARLLADCHVDFTKGRQL